MTLVLASFLDVAETIGYPLVFGLIAIETMGIPVPGETALVTASIVASRGRLDIEVVIALAAAAAILGDNVGFAIGRKLGRRLLTAPGPFRTTAAASSRSASRSSTVTGRRPSSSGAGWPGCGSRRRGWPG